MSSPMLSGERTPAARGERRTPAGEERRFVELAPHESAAPFVEEWEHLARTALEANVFCEPWLLLPALDCFADEQVRVGFTFDSKSNELTGVFPFRRVRRWNRLPVSARPTWIHDQSYLGTPLLHRDPDRAKQAIREFIQAAVEASIVEFDDVSGDGEFMRLLMEVVAEKDLAWLVTHSNTRPILRPRNSADDYLGAALDGDGRRKLRSKKKGLAALGEVRVSVATESELDSWIDDFVRLEAAGWKGKLGTAFANLPASRRFFETVLRDGFRRGSVMALSLYAGDRRVAMKVNLSAGDEWFAYKIAYDEELARHSPGLQLEVENIRLVHELGGVRSMDSCTGPTTRVFRELWLDRRAIQSVVVATGSEPGPFVVAALPLLRWGKRTIRARVPAMAQTQLQKPSPRDVASLPLASKPSLPRRIGASPFALAAMVVSAARGRPDDLRSVLKHAARLQCGRTRVIDFHDELDAFFAKWDVDRALADLNYARIRTELDHAHDCPNLRRVTTDCPLWPLVRAASELSIRMDFELLRAGQQIPPHGHSRVASGFCVIDGKVGLRRYDLVESLPDSVTLRPTFDGVLSPGQASTESDERDNVHWIVALEDSVLFRLTAFDVPSRSPVPASLNLWVDPRAPLRGDDTILGRWIPEAVARTIPPYVPE